jgi:uncharacterized protein with FMN-binding domain
MPRVVPTLILTAVAAFLLFSFRAAPGKVSLGSTAVTAPAAPPRAGAQTRRRARKPHAQAKKSPAPPTTQTVTGDALQDPYGTVQVAVKLKGGRIVDVTPVAIPLDSGQSQEINTQAAPILRSEVLQAQSAQVDIVSGATYTSEAYARSLQSALIRARG